MKRTQFTTAMMVLGLSTSACVRARSGEDVGAGCADEARHQWYELAERHPADLETAWIGLAALCEGPLTGAAAGDEAYRLVRQGEYSTSFVRLVRTGNESLIVRARTCERGSEHDRAGGCDRIERRLHSEEWTAASTKALQLAKYSTAPRDTFEPLLLERFSEGKYSLVAVDLLYGPLADELYLLAADSNRAP